jgi:hypothetical protein
VSSFAEFSVSVGLTSTGSEEIDSVRARGAIEVAILVDVLFFSINEGLGNIGWGNCFEH